MKRYFFLALIAGIAITSGCASNKSTITYLDKNGQPTHTITTDMTDSATYHHEQGQLKLAALKNRKPIARFVIPEGATLKAEGGDVSLEVWGNPEQWMSGMDQYVEPYISLLEKGGPYALLTAWLYQQGWGPNQDPAKRLQGQSTTIQDSFNNSASGSSTGYAPGAGRDVIMSPVYRHYPSTTTNITGGE